VLRRCGFEGHHGTTIIARRALSPSSPRAARAARPFGLRGLTAQRGQARGLPCHECRKVAARKHPARASERALARVTENFPVPVPARCRACRKRNWEVTRWGRREVLEFSQRDDSRRCRP
jgi:hypothetical protein